MAQLFLFCRLDTCSINNLSVLDFGCETLIERSVYFIGLTFLREGFKLTGNPPGSGFFGHS